MFGFFLLSKNIMYKVSSVPFYTVFFWFCSLISSWLQTPPAHQTDTREVSSAEGPACCSTPAPHPGTASCRPEAQASSGRPPVIRSPQMRVRRVWVRGRMKHKQKTTRTTYERLPHQDPQDSFYIDVSRWRESTYCKS